MHVLLSLVTTLILSSQFFFAFDGLSPDHEFPTLINIGINSSSQTFGFHGAL